MDSLALGFSNYQHECSQLALQLQGKLPEWLNGTLLRNGPGQFHAGTQALQHWFDGFAMLQHFNITPHSIYFSNRFIQSQAFLKANTLQKNYFVEFATQPQENIFQKIKRIFHPILTDNTNVNAIYFNNQWLALTETCRYNSIDIEGLTSKKFEYADHLPGHLTTAHPQYDPQEKAWYNFTVHIGLKCYYHFYKILNNQTKRQLICSIPTRSPAYNHSFAMTQNYLILIECPLRMKLLDFILSRDSYIKTYEWRKDLATIITIIDKRNGEIVCKTETEAFFMFHQMNAYEHNQSLILELPSYTDQQVINSLYLDNIKSEKFNIPSAIPKRLIINLQNKQVQQEIISGLAIEFPRINNTHINDKNYQHVYACSKRNNDRFFTQLIKLNVQTGHSLVWHEANCYPVEPIFVAKSQAIDEDDGVILSVILNLEEQYSFLIILDAKNFSEVARANLPFALPLGLHGDFISDT